MILNYVGEVNAGRGGPLGDALRDIFADAGRDLRRQPVKALVHEVRTIDDRLKHIRRLIRKYRYDPRARELAMKILTVQKKNGEWKVPEKDWLGEAKALFEAIRANVRYVRDPYGMDTYVSAFRTLTQYHGADCDCSTIAYATLAQAIGIPVKLKVIRTHGNDTWNHIYLVIGMPPTQPERWIAVDLTATGKPFGWQAPKSMIAEQRYFTID
jgi:hypothetical protein